MVLQLNKVVEEQRWHIATLPTISANQVRTELEFKVPSDFKQLEEVFISATRAGDEIKSHIIGVLTMNINGRRSNPLQYEVRVKMLNQVKRKFETIKLDEPILGNTLIQIHYRDTAGFAGPATYDLKIYFKGTHINKIP